MYWRADNASSILTGLIVLPRVTILLTSRNDAFETIASNGVLVETFHCLTMSKLTAFIPILCYKWKHEARAKVYAAS